jgi:hypothetical protein
MGINKYTGNAGETSLLKSLFSVIIPTASHKQT